MSDHRLEHRASAEILLAVGTLALLVFYYALRGDGVGVFNEERGWQLVIAPTLPLPLHYAASAIVLGVLPVLAARRVMGLSLGELGLGLGDWRAGARWLAVGVPLACVAGWVGAQGEPMRAVYPLDASMSPDVRTFAPYALLQFLYYGAWEVLFRGVLLFGLARRFGAAGANISQTGLSVTAHFGRAFSETFSAFPAGIVFGWLTLRLGSVWYIAIIHWIVGVSCDWFIISR